VLHCPAYLCESETALKGEPAAHFQHSSELHDLLWRCMLLLAIFAFPLAQALLRRARWSCPEAFTVSMVVFKGIGEAFGALRRHKQGNFRASKGQRSICKAAKRRGQRGSALIDTAETSDLHIESCWALGWNCARLARRPENW
jgi:hypothetical protein